MAGKSAILTVKILTDATKGAAGLKKSGDSVGKWSSSVQKATVPAAAALGAIGVAAVGAAKAAAADAKAQTVLAGTMRRSTGATDKQVAAMESYIEKTSKAVGVSDDELRPALGNLLRATKDQAKSQEAMNTALDVHAATGADVQAVSKAIAKAYGGSTGALKKLIPSLDEATLKSGDMEKIMGEVAKVTGGAAAEAANTAEGKIARMQIAMDETQETMGTALLPAMSTLADLMLVASEFAQKHSTALTVLIAVIAGLAAAVIAINVATKIYNATLVVMAAVQKAAWLSNPITLVLAAVIALVAGIVILWKKSDKFRAFILGMWDAIKRATSATAEWLKNAWNKSIAAITAAINAFKANVLRVWAAIKAAVAVVVSWIVGNWQKAFNGAAKAVEAVKTAVRKLGEWIGKLNLTAPFDALMDTLDWIIRKVQDVISWLGKIKVPKIKLPFGIGGNAAPPPVPGFAPRGPGPAPMAVGPSVQVNVYGAVDPENTARQIKRIIGGHERRTGKGAGLHGLRVT